MADPLVSPTAIKVLHEASDLLLVPVTILAVWSQSAPSLLPWVGGSSILALALCCLIGYLGAIGLYQLLAWVAIHTRYSFFPIFGTVLAGAGLVVVFQSQMAAQVATLSHFTGAAMVIWGLLLDAVHDRVIVRKNRT